MRPTGRLHLGHLVGALNNWVPLQDQYECFYFVADWHALTSEYTDTSKVVENAYTMVADSIAAGLDPEKSTFFVQSLVPEHAELFLLLSMVVPVPWLERVPTYKEQQEDLKDRDLSTLGLSLLPAAPDLRRHDVRREVRPGRRRSGRAPRALARSRAPVQQLVRRRPRRAAAAAHAGVAAARARRRQEDEQEHRQHDRSGGRPRHRRQARAADVHGPEARPRRHSRNGRGQPGASSTTTRSTPTRPKSTT